MGIPAAVSLHDLVKLGSVGDATHMHVSLGTPLQSESSPVTVQESAPAGATAPTHCPNWPLAAHTSDPYWQAPTGVPVGQEMGAPSAVALHVTISPGVHAQFSLTIPLQLSS
jgi:hypothetical protein